VSDTLICPSCGGACQPAHRYCPACGFPVEKLREQADDPLIGTTLPGGHVVLELIDVGGMGRVYRAEQKMLGRTVAVKIIHPHLLGDAAVEARFITEARAASQLNHPNSVGVIDFGKHEGRLYMVMEYLRGRDLATVAHEDGPLAIERIIDILGQTLAALEEAHHLGIVHRDLKPENIVLSPMRSGGDFVKVLDFGLAKVLEEARKGKRITDPGMVCGTPEYMAPEQARGEDVDHRADLYSAGVVLYELLTGQLPFEGATPRETVLMHLSQPIPDPREIVPDRGIVDGLAAIVQKALAKEPKERFQRASDFGRALRDVGEPRPTSLAPEAGLHCPSCGALVPKAQKFCGECGTRVAQQPTPEPAPGRPVERKEDREELPLRFVGRGDELAWLARLRDKAQGSLVAGLLVGHPGVGKTRLVHEFVAQAERRGDTVVIVGPDPWWAERGYHALRAAVQQLASLPADGGAATEWEGATRDARAGLERLFGRRDKTPGSKRRWATALALGPSAESRRALVAEALRWALSNAQQRSKSGRVVLAVDNLHAVDGASRNAFADVIAEPPLVGALLLAAGRGTPVPAWEGADVMELRGLPTSVAARLLGGHKDSDEMAAAAESEVPPTSGSPLGEVHLKRVSPMYVEQLLRFTREGGSDPPPKLADLIALRAERLPAEARRVLQGLAVLGDATVRSQLVMVLPDAVGQLDQSIEELVRAGFVERHGDHLACSHPLIREITVASSPAAVRRTLHARARGAALNDAPRPLEADAVHAYHAAAPFEALMLLEHAADQALEREDAEGAVRFLHMALDLARREMVRGELDDPVGAVLLFSGKLGDALTVAGKQHDAEGVLLEALDLAGPASPERARLLASLAATAHRIGRPDAAYQHLDEALRIAEKTGPPDLLESLERLRSRWVTGA
jgi:protein kinase-like protein/AAA ATPase-like protein